MILRQHSRQNRIPFSPYATLGNFNLSKPSDDTCGLELRVVVALECHDSLTVPCIRW